MPEEIRLWRAEEGDKLREVSFSKLDLEKSEEGDFYIRSGPQSVKLDPDSATEYVKTRWPA